ncbi:MAG: type III secretion system chaperone [Gammaproteobacteria bacterium]
MRFKQLIQGLCDRLDIEFPFDTQRTTTDTSSQQSDQSFELFSDDRRILFQQRKNELLLFTSLGEIPASREEKQIKYKELLLACGSGAWHFGSIVSVDQSSNRIVVHQKFPLNSLSILDLEHALDRFLLSVDHYNNVL